MHERVEHGEEGGVAPAEPAGAGPAGQGHDAVVNDVEEAATKPSFMTGCPIQGVDIY